MKRRTRSRAGTSRDDRRNVHQGRLYGMTSLHVILTTLLVRIPAPREKGTIGPGQSLFSLTALSGFSLFSDQRILGTRSRADPLNRIFLGQGLRDNSPLKHLFYDENFLHLENCLQPSMKRSLCYQLLLLRLL